MKNLHDVPKKQWKKWPEISQRVFNQTFEDMEQNPALFTHPKTGKIAKEQWGTVSWNSAWIAAENVLLALKEMAGE